MTETLPFAVFADFISLCLILGSASLIAFTTHFSGSTSAAVVFRDLGTPLGLLGAMVGAFGGSLNTQDAAEVYPYTAIILIAVLYGGILSGAGVFIAGKRSCRRPNTDNAVSDLHRHDDSDHALYVGNGRSSR